MVVLVDDVVLGRRGSTKILKVSRSIASTCQPRKVLHVTGYLTGVYFLIGGMVKGYLLNQNGWFRFA